MLTRPIVYFAYGLKTSNRYKACKRFCYDLLENPQSRRKSYFDVFMIVLVMISVFLLVYEVEHGLHEAGELFERGVVCVFIVEYLLRAWLYSDTHKIIIQHYERAQYLNIPFSLAKALRHILATKLEYMFSLIAIIDLLAILPSYRPLRILRILLILRLFKLFRYSNSIKVFSDVLASKRFELITLAIFMGFLVFISSIAIYLFENPSSGGSIKHGYDAFYWAIVTLSTVGYGDITPQTHGGRFITISLILSGLGVLSFFTSIIVAAFSDKMHALRENRIYAELSRYKNFMIICGFGRVGQEIAAKLAQDKTPFVVIDTNEACIELAKQKQYLAIHDDASENRVLTQCGICQGASAVLCTTSNDVTNVYITLTSRYLNPDIQIITRANRQDNVAKLYQAGANQVIQPFAIAGLLAAEFIGQPVAFEAISGILHETKQIVMNTVTVQPGSFLVQMAIGNVGFVQRKLTLVGVISSNNAHLKHRNRYQLKNRHFYFNPDKHFELQEQDLLIVLGREYSLEHFRDQVEKSRLEKTKQR
jgi:voltage-gated potassium channel